jgi:hypothetical protein
MIRQRPEIDRFHEDRSFISSLASIRSGRCGYHRPKKSQFLDKASGKRPFHLRLVNAAYRSVIWSAGDSIETAKPVGIEPARDLFAC